MTVLRMDPSRGQPGGVTLRLSVEAPLGCCGSHQSRCVLRAGRQAEVLDSSTSALPVETSIHSAGYRESR